ncbi:MAG: hypothetical protein JXR94_11735, partial [Candidatus Hydrogenedentes bacterium]|nr:hypothetical protein [Candidatus Hydrogenedentota bacterium]
HLEFTPELPDKQVVQRYGARFDVTGQWNSNQTYEMRIAPGLTYSEKATLKEASVRRVTSQEVPAFLGFGYPGAFYFPRRTDAGLPLVSRNLDKATVKVHRMFPGNVAVALQDMRDGEANWRFVGSWSEETGEQAIAVASRPDRLVETPLDLDTLLPEAQNGVFCLQASSGDRYGGTKLVVRTDIGALAHWQNPGETTDSELVVFAHDLFTLAPLRLATVTVYSSKNQVLGVVNTDADGMAHLGPFEANLGAPQVVVIEHGDDYAFLELDPREDDERAFTYEMPPYDREGYDAFLYADRDLYRPGETAHIRWIVRTNYRQPVPDVPLVITVVKPNQRNLLSEPTTLSALGTGGLDVTTQRSYPTGRYTVKLNVPGVDKPIGTYTFNLEDFVPNRIKAEVSAPEPRWLAGTENELRVRAQHLFGAPAADRKCEATILLKRGGFEPEAWQGYRFENDADFTPDAIACGELRTDANGEAAFTFTYQAPAKATSPMRAIAVGRVFELGGRAVAGTAEAMMFPSDVCLGIAASPRSGATGLDVHVAAIAPDESPAALDTVTVALEKRTWSYYVRRYYSHHEPKWSESFEVQEAREVELRDGAGTTAFDVSGYGYYRVRVYSDKTPQYSTATFYSYGGECHPVDSARPSLIKVTLDKEEYTVGDTAQVRLESPFDGQGVVVVQGGEIQRILPVPIRDGVGQVSVPVGEAQFPNVWIEATVVHAVEEGRTQMYPFSSFAMANLNVTDPARRLDIAFPSLPEEIRPNTELVVDVLARTSDGQPAAAELTIAAVDEGIHAITGYENPDPAAWLGRPRRPDFRRAHYYDKVAYDFEKPDAAGDLDALLGKRAASVDENWIRPVALWSGIVQ